MASYLITGGAGFIGSHLADALLAAGHRVHVLDDLSTGRRGNLPADACLTVADVNDDAALDAIAADGLDGCFHLAAVASVQRCNEEWVATHDVNLRGTISVLEAARRFGFPVVYASSAAVYGDCDRLPLREDDAPTRPLTAYGADKLGSELHARVAGVVHGVSTFGLRFFNVFGPRQDPASPYSGVVSIFADRLARNEPVTIHGDGGQSRDFVYVGDVVRALVAALRKADVSAPVANVCTGRATTVRTLAETLATLTASTAAISTGPARTGDIRHSLGDPGVMAHALGVTADVSLADGLGALLSHASPGRPPIPAE
ncbi:UDP-glucose 4-epimerase [Caenispirillum salinarum AK4]|uniref:UDP-glucose 4-epimerase n=1 Tax=Caenispirillum salinarum AK4 TaxID=1238182 RepID=K9GVI9_9PROT|nr:NAD-dependent epimerase/dehydratase family protein [Caenispirillum salinarum]EKV29207.1 UDP-glucose 4-epimerase [Caenispirillum salinarum AK4]